MLRVRRDASVPITALGRLKAEVGGELWLVPKARGLLTVRFADRGCRRGREGIHMASPLHEPRGWRPVALGVL